MWGKPYFLEGLKSKCIVTPVQHIGRDYDTSKTEMKCSSDLDLKDLFKIFHNNLQNVWKSLRQALLEKPCKMFENL